jgi:hypothetical protein
MHSDRISGMDVSCGRQDGLTFLGSPQVFARFRVGQRFIYMCFVFFTGVNGVRVLPNIFHNHSTKLFTGIN